MLNCVLHGDSRQIQSHVVRVQRGAIGRENDDHLGNGVDDRAKVRLAQVDHLSGLDAVIRTHS
jgi:hypothetical protein